MAGDLPPEIWREIFVFSCMDDGSTGRALSLVSRDFHLLSCYCKYQSVAITRPKYIIRFLRILLETPEQLRRIRYLLLATSGILWGDSSGEEMDLDYTKDDEDMDTESDGASSVASWADEDAPLTQEDHVDLADDLFFFDTPDGKPANGPPVNFDQVPSIVKETEIAEDILIDAINKIITISSSSLITLTVYLIARLPYAPFLTTPVPLPELRELSLWYHVRDPRLEAPIPANSIALFPALESLHLGWGIYPTLLPRITHFAPRLMNLRFPFDPAIFEIDDDPNPWHFLSLLPNTLNNILVDIGGDPQDIIDFQSLEFDKYPNARAHLTICRQEEVPCIKVDWLNRMAGGLGEWEYQELDFVT